MLLPKEKHSRGRARELFWQIANIGEAILKASSLAFSCAAFVITREYIRRDRAAGDAIATY